MKIWHFPANYPDPANGKPFDMIFIAEHIRSANLYHDNVVLIGSAQQPQNGRLFGVTRQVENGVFVIRYQKRNLGNTLLDAILHHYLLGKEMLHLWVGGFRPDIFHIHIFAEARLPVVLAYWLNIPVVVTEHWSALCRPDILSKDRLMLARKIYEKAAMVLPVCEHLQKCIQQNTGAKFHSQIVLNAVDISIFYWQPINGEHTLHHQILMVARLEEPKDIATLLYAFSILYQRAIVCQLSIIGRGNAVPFIALADELGVLDLVDFLGEKPKAEIANRIRQSDVFVLSSLWENSPCVIGEALCCGLPVVATAVGGVPELISPESGILVPPQDPLALANAIADVLSHPELYDRELIAKRAQQRFSYEAIGSQLDEIYTGLVSSRKEHAN